jgi:hypothetical protein
MASNYLNSWSGGGDYYVSWLSNRSAALDSEDIARQNWETETYYRYILRESVYADVPIPFPIDWGESIYY